MAGRWDEPQERGYRSYEDRYDVFGLNDERDRGDHSGREDRSFERGDRVFGERESGVGYNRPQPGSSGGRDYRSREGGRGEGWQSPDYGGVSPAMQRGEYDAGYRANPNVQRQDYTRGGGRFYGDDGRGGISREQDGRGVDYGPFPRGHEEGRRFATREADERWAREMRHRASGGNGGYDYERGYGDGGRGYGGRDHERFEERAHDAGEFFRRTGQKISNWFGDIGREDGRDDADRGHRGLGPKGYKRSDERINDDVHQHLTDDHYLDATHVDVAVSAGEVTLSGTVETREAKHRAERLVEHLSGVTHVQNNLRVQPTQSGPGAYTPAGSGSGSVGNGRFGTGVADHNLREEGDAASTTSANARNKT